LILPPFSVLIRALDELAWLDHQIRREETESDDEPDIEEPSRDDRRASFRKADAWCW
jgi:hypothetical protein